MQCIDNIYLIEANINGSNRQFATSMVTITTGNCGVYWLRHQNERNET